MERDGQFRFTPPTHALVSFHQALIELEAEGGVSGRAKPMFTLMTDIGKITLYHGTVLEGNEKNELLIQSHYTIDDFKYRNYFDKELVNAAWSFF